MVWKYRTCVLGVLISTSFLAVPGMGIGNACAEYVPASNEPGPTLVNVASTLGILQPDPIACSGEPVFYSYAVKCDPYPFMGSVAGAYCGQQVAPGGSVRCMWSPVSISGPTKLYVGFDINLDGHITSSAGELVYGPMDPSPVQYILHNLSPSLGRVIAFPTNVQNYEQREFDSSLVGCL